MNSLSENYPKMKTYINTLCLFLFMNLSAQINPLTDKVTNPLDVSQDFSTFYIGISLGYAIPGGNAVSNLDDGLDVGFAHLGYRFSENWGVVANLNSSGHHGNDNVGVGIAYTAIGPMYSIAVNDRMRLDIKPQAAIRLVGVNSGAGYVITSYGIIDLDDFIFVGNGLLFGTSLVMGDQTGFAFSINLDYLSANFETIEYGGEEADWYSIFNTQNDINMFKIGVGARYNF